MSKAMLALIYSNGRMYEGPEGLMYNGAGPKVLNINRGISLDSLKLKIHSKLKLQASQVVSNVIYRFPVWCNVLKFIALKLEDDEDVVCMFDSYEQHPNLTSMDLYIEVESSSGNFNSASMRENEGPSTCGLAQESKVPPNRDELLDVTEVEGVIPDRVDDDSSDDDVDRDIDANVNLQQGSSREAAGKCNSGLAMLASPVSYLPLLGGTAGPSTRGPLLQPMNPGPDDPSLLTLQSVHCSQRIWNGKGDRVLRVRRAHRKGHDLPPVVIVPYLQQAGFYGVARLGFIQCDHHLISAFVERWRPETHTFHMPQGECTITLQDVSIQTGLPIDGLPVTGVSLYDWAGLCGRLLGTVPPPSAMMGGRLNMTWLDDRFRELPQNAPDVMVQQFARAYILRLIGGVLFVDKSGRFVHLMYLPLLEDFQVAGSYGWGSACLAFLYRELCRATDYDAKDIGGACLLLQLWAWDRFPHIAPKRLGLIEDIHESEEHDRALSGPLGCRWRDRKSFTEASTHVISQYRYQLDCLKVREIIWQPYTDDMTKNLPDYCFTGREIWCAVVPLICFAIVEWHQPDRVMRQFGFCQPIPHRPFQPEHLHDVDLRGRHDVYWPREHSQYISIWQKRHNQVVSGKPFSGYLSANSEYMRWYWRVTRRYISQVGAGLGMVVDNVERMHKWTTPQGQPTFSFDGLQQSCKTILGALDEQDRISTPQSEAAPPAEDIPGPSEDDGPRHGRRRRPGLASKRRRVEHPQTHACASHMQPAPRGEQDRPKGNPSSCANGTKHSGPNANADDGPDKSKGLNAPHASQVVDVPRRVQLPRAGRASSSNIQ